MRGSSFNQIVTRISFVYSSEHSSTNGREIPLMIEFGVNCLNAPLTVPTFSWATKSIPIAFRWSHWSSPSATTSFLLCKSSLFFRAFVKWGGSIGSDRIRSVYHSPKRRFEPTVDWNITIDGYRTHLASSLSQTSAEAFVFGVQCFHGTSCHQLFTVMLESHLDC
jgi:hypothetical protein